MNTISAYLESLPADKKAALEALCRQIKQIVPEAEEGWAYSIPTYKYRGKSLVGFAAGKHFLSLYPYGSKVIELYADDLKGFEGTKGSVHFSVERPIPYEVLAKIVKFHKARIDEKLA